MRDTMSDTSSPGLPRTRSASSINILEKSSSDCSLGDTQGYETTGSTILPEGYLTGLDELYAFYFDWESMLEYDFFIMVLDEYEGIGGEYDGSTTLRFLEKLRTRVRVSLEFERRYEAHHGTSSSSDEESD